MSVEPGQVWGYKPNRGTGRFTVIRVKSDRITLRGYFGKDKTISSKTLRGDYQHIKPKESV